MICGIQFSGIGDRESNLKFGIPVTVLIFTRLLLEFSVEKLVDNPFFLFCNDVLKSFISMSFSLPTATSSLAESLTFATDDLLPPCSGLARGRVEGVLNFDLLAAAAVRSLVDIRFLVPGVLLDDN